MTTHRSDFELDRPGTLIAALPAVLGFVPEKSLVLVSIDGGEMGAVMRVDLSADLAERVGQLAEVAAAASPEAAIAVIVDADGPVARCARTNTANSVQRSTTRCRNATSCYGPLMWWIGWPRVDAGAASTVVGPRVSSMIRRRRRWRWLPCWTGGDSTLAGRPAGRHRGRRHGGQRRVGGSDRRAVGVT
ncbi:hypothetical protein I552_5269 [Mycobacterium xenopi 3993]|nr:hypothetical protein I552_5269 [Mycobacterium xenopi 3993]